MPFLAGDITSLQAEGTNEFYGMETILGCINCPTIGITTFTEICVIGFNSICLALLVYF